MLYFLAVFFAMVPATRQIHVSPGGSDQAPGSLDSPVRTVEQAIRLARSAKSTSEPVEIVVDPGSYAISHPIEITSGLGPITITGIGKPSFFAGLSLTHWQPITDQELLGRLAPDARGKVLVTDLPQRVDSNIDGVDLVFNGSPMHLAAYPNEGWLRTTVASGQTFGFNSDHPQNWKDPSTLWVQGFLTYDWSDSLTPATVDPNSKTVTLAKDPHYGIAAQRRFRFLNILEELDSPGEFFVDRKDSKVYFWPPAAINDSTYLTASNLATIFHVENVSGLALRGVRLEGGRHSAVTVTGSTAVSISNCEITNFGGPSVVIEKSTMSGVSNSTIEYAGTDAVILNGGDKIALTKGSLYVKNSRISNYARWHMCYHPAVRLEGNSNTVSHCLIEKAPHQAIYVLGSEMLIEYNEIRTVCLETGDAGAIYQDRDFLGVGEKIQFNRFTDISPRVSSPGGYDTVACVYLDDLWSGATVFGNVFNCSARGVMVHGGRDNTIENNVFVGSQPAIYIDASGRGKNMSTNAIRGGAWNLIGKVDDALTVNPELGLKYPRLRAIQSGTTPLDPEGNSVARNIYFGEHWMDVRNGLTDAYIGVKGNVLGHGSTITEALSLAPPGFVTIDQSQIGPIPKKD